MSALSGVVALPAVGLAALLAGCSTASSHIENGTFHSPKGYTVRLPEGGWRVAPGGPADIALTRDAPPGGMLADATCEAAGRERPLAVLARHLTFGLTRRTTVESDEHTLSGHPVAHRVVRGVVDGTEVAVEAIVVKGERCVHDFLYVAPAVAFEVGRPGFRAFVESLTPGAVAR